MCIISIFFGGGAVLLFPFSRWENFREVSRFPVLTQPGQGRARESVHRLPDWGVFSFAVRSFHTAYGASQERELLRDKERARYSNFFQTKWFKSDSRKHFGQNSYQTHTLDMLWGL